jgi:two-component system sensor histidine kinase MprB
VTLRARLALLTGAAVACAVVIGAIVTYAVVHDLLYQQVDDSLRSRVAELTSLSVGFGGKATSGGYQIQILAPGPSSLPQTLCTTTQIASPPARPACNPKPKPGTANVSGGQVIAIGVPVTVLGAAGSYTQFVTKQGAKVLAPGEDQALPVTPTDIAAANGHARLTLRTDTINGTPVRIATAQMSGGLAVMVARPLDETEAVLANLRHLLFLIGAAGVALAAGLGVIVARATMSPVRRLIAATDHVAGTRDLTRRIHVRGGSELDHLAMSFNRMLEALERSETVQRQLVADASHELRTPLTSLRTNIEVLAHDRRMPAPERKRLLASVVGQLERLTDLVTGLIDLARGNEPVNAQADIALDDVVDLVVGNARAHWPNLTFAVSTDGSKVHGDAALLERAVSNLVDNAAKWSLADGTVDVSIEHGEVRVRDHGPGVAAADRARVFDRFWRSPTARQMPGSGLGLAIVRQVAQAHKGEVTVEEAKGGGALFVMRLPLSSS